MKNLHESFFAAKHAYTMGCENIYSHEGVPAKLERLSKQVTKLAEKEAERAETESIMQDVASTPKTSHTLEIRIRSDGLHPIMAGSAASSSTKRNGEDKEQGGKKKKRKQKSDSEE